MRNDIFEVSKNYHILESWTDTSSSIKYKGQVVLLEEAPLLRSHRGKHIEKVFWSNITLDSLTYYRHYIVKYYRKTKYLTKDFKAGGQYHPIYSYWDNTMDWRNHREDQVGQIRVLTMEDGIVYYYADVYEYYFSTLFNSSGWSFSGKIYKSLQELYRAKCKEFGIAN